MEDDVSTIPSFLQSPKNWLKDDRFSPQSTAHFFGGCNSHGGSQSLLFRHELKANKSRRVSYETRGQTSRGTYDVKAQKHRKVGEAHAKPWTECEIRWN
ncbi:BnaA09g09030D [Brassica napus]|uniref:BnaA09g09030D protein n=1 Tax=Brassica napus TaxID=3708 RepID=A0A078IDR0_BRANA|nr:BnaA09g09030D [Brassica napus]